MRTDPIADMLTIIRNANRIYRPTVDIVHSRIKEGIVNKLKQEGFIKDYEVLPGSPGKTIKVQLKYGPDGEFIIREIHRKSKPSRRLYQKVTDMKRILEGQGISIVSTPKGIMTDRECHKNKVGGEVLCVVW